MKHSPLIIIPTAALCMLAGCCSPGGHSANARLEYKIIRQDIGQPNQENYKTNLEELQRALNALAGEGWSLVQMRPLQSDGVPRYEFIVSRPSR